MEHYNYYDEFVQEEGLKPEKWMLDALNYNYGHCLWGPYQDFMNFDSHKWITRQIFNNWKQFSGWTFDDHNGIVRFYFEIHRKSLNSSNCDLGLSLWSIHPRRSSSRGIHITIITKGEMPGVINFLKRADEHNRLNFSKLYQTQI
jgi:hypothetical protein